MNKIFGLVFISVLSATSYGQTLHENTLYSQAVRSLNSSDLDGAVSTLQKLLELYPTSARAYNLCGAIFSKQGEYRQAIEMFHKSIRADSTSLVSYQNLGNAYIDQGELDSAIAIHRLLIARDSATADYRNDLGDAYMKREDIAQAELCFRKALELNPHYTLAHANLAAVYARQKKYKEAIDELFLVRNLDGSYPRLQEELHLLAMAAESELEAWVKTEPNSSDAHYYYSFYRYYTADPDEAVEEIEEAIRIDSRAAKNYLLKAVWLWNGDKNEEAIADCKKCLELSPDDWRCHNQMAFCYQNMQEVPRVIEHLRQSVEIDSLVIETQFALGEAYAVEEEYEKSIDALNRALRLGHRSPWANYDLAICHYKVGRYQLALDNIMYARNWNEKSPVKGMEAQLDQLQRIVVAKMD